MTTFGLPLCKKKKKNQFCWFLSLSNNAVINVGNPLINTHSLITHHVCSYKEVNNTWIVVQMLLLEEDEEGLFTMWQPKHLNFFLMANN